MNGSSRQDLFEYRHTCDLYQSVVERVEDATIPEHRLSDIIPDVIVPKRDQELLVEFVDHAFIHNVHGFAEHILGEQPSTPVSR